MEMPNQRPRGWRKWAGTRASSTSDDTSPNRPACSARHSRPASTVIRISAGLFAPSFLIRSIKASPLPSIRLMRIPGGLGEALVERLVSLIMA